MVGIVALVILIGIGGYRRWWVWGWMYDREKSRADTSDTQAERNAESLEVMAKSYEVMARSYDRLDDAHRPTRRVNRDAT